MSSSSASSSSKPLFDPKQILPMNNPELEKIIILDGHAEDYSACTFCLYEEDHTLGNVLRWMIMKNPDVEFCAYSLPHPSEAKIHLRIQMYDNLSAITCLFTALANLRELYGTIAEAYEESLKDTSTYTPTSDTDIPARVAAIVAEGDKKRAASDEQWKRRQAVDLEGEGEEDGNGDGDGDGDVEMR